MTLDNFRNHLWRLERAYVRAGTYLTLDCEARDHCLVLHAYVTRVGGRFREWLGGLDSAVAATNDHEAISEELNQVLGKRDLLIMSKVLHAYAILIRDAKRNVGVRRSMEVVARGL
jgi:hypothetical protein